MGTVLSDNSVRCVAPTSEYAGLARSLRFAFADVDLDGSNVTGEGAHALLLGDAVLRYQVSPAAPAVAAPAEDDTNGTNSSNATVSACETCALQFAANGGCALVMRGEDPTALVPEGCIGDDNEGCI